MARYRDAQQYVDSPVDRAGASHDVVGELEQRSASATVRVEYTWSPLLSLQMYARPYVTGGAFSQYREVSASRARAFDDRYVTVAGGAPGEVIAVDRDGDGASDYEFADASFDWRSLQSTMVLRWEYRPGSSLSLIWNHNRASVGDDGRFALVDELSALADAAGVHVVLLKADYWLDR